MSPLDNSFRKNDTILSPPINHTKSLKAKPLGVADASKAALSHSSATNHAPQPIRYTHEIAPLPSPAPTLDPDDEESDTGRTISLGKQVLNQRDKPQPNALEQTEITKDLRPIQRRSLEPKPLGETPESVARPPLAQRIEKAALATISRHTLLKKIAQGKAKKILGIADVLGASDPKTAFIVPLKSSKKHEIEAEYETVKNIRSVLTNIYEGQGSLEDSPTETQELIANASHYLALNLEVASSEEKSLLSLSNDKTNKKQGLSKEYVLKTEQATGDLDRSLGSFNWTTALHYCHQIAGSLAVLHSAGYVHGDLKLENFLVYDDHIKLADFGKTKALLPDQFTIHEGNPRFAAPEGYLSHKAEVYSAAVLMISILESCLKSEDDFLRPEGVTFKALTYALDKRKGIEKYLILNADTPHRDNGLIIENALVRSAALVRFTQKKMGMMACINLQDKENLKKAEQAVTRYIEELESKVHLADLPPRVRQQVLTICGGIRLMINADPEQRPTMHRIFNAINADLIDPDPPTL